MGEVIKDDRLLDIVLEGLTDEYLQTEYNAEAGDHFSRENDSYTMRNMNKNRMAKNGHSRNQKRRELTMVRNNFQSEREVPNVK